MLARYKSFVFWIVVGLSFIILLKYLIYTTQHPDSEKTPSACRQLFSKVLQHWISAYRSCLLEQIRSQDNSFWNHLHAAIDKCLGETVFRIFDIRLLWNGVGDDGDVKLVILSPRTSRSGACSVVTLGIGNDIDVERQLGEMANCTFFGADPIWESGKIYKEIGNYFEVAVSTEVGILEASVLENGTYHSKNVSTVTLVDFLGNYAKIDKVDYLFMDNEGAEYSLLRQFTRGGLIETKEFSICQLSVELHGPWGSYGVNETYYENLIASLILNSGFVPLWSSAPQYHNIDSACMCNGTDDCSSVFILNCDPTIAWMAKHALCEPARLRITSATCKDKDISLATYLTQLVPDACAASTTKGPETSTSSAWWTTTHSGTATPSGQCETVITVNCNCNCN